MLRPSTLVLALTITSSAASAAGVTYVGPPGSGAPFSDIQPAIDAAAPGDTIVVLPMAQPGYSGFALSKPLRILGSGSAFGGASTSHVLGYVDVQGLPAGTEAVVGGLHVNGGGLRITGNAGLVSIFDVDGGRLTIASSARVLLCSSPCFGTTVQSSTVWAADCTFVGSSGPYVGLCGFGPLLPGMPGILATDSTLYLARCAVKGGDGGECSTGIGIGFHPKASGGDGVHASGSTLKLVGGPGNSIQVGQGPFPFTSTPPFPFALSLVNGSASLQSGDTVLIGYTGQPPVQSDLSSQVYLVPTIYPTMRTSRSTLVPGSSFVVTGNGSAGAVLAIFSAASSAPEILLAGVDGAFALDTASVALFELISLGTGGQGQKTTQVPLDPGLVGAQIFLQAVEVGGPALAFSNPLIEAVVP